MLIIKDYRIRRSGAGMRISGTFYSGTDAPRTDRISNVTEIRVADWRDGKQRVFAYRTDVIVAVLE